MFEIGQRLFVKSLHHSHSAWNKDWFLGRVVVVYDIAMICKTPRYWVHLVANSKRFIGLDERYLEPLNEQELNDTDLRCLGVEFVKDADKFDQAVLNEGRTQDDFRRLFDKAKIAVERGDKEILVNLKTVFALLENVGIHVENSKIG